MIYESLLSGIFRRRDALTWLSKSIISASLKSLLMIFSP
jgi:hypothetical protein